MTRDWPGQSCRAALSWTRTRTRTRTRKEQPVIACSTVTSRCSAWRTMIFESWLSRPGAAARVPCRAVIAESVPGPGRHGPGPEAASAGTSRRVDITARIPNHESLQIILPGRQCHPSLSELAQLEHGAGQCQSYYKSVVHWQDYYDLEGLCPGSESLCRRCRQAGSCRLKPPPAARDWTDHAGLDTNHDAYDTGH